MKAIVYTKYGSPDVLSLQQVEKPTPQANQVLVNVHTSSINSWDWDLLRGSPFVIRLEGLSKPKYKILGADVAGHVESVGSGITRFKAGDAVYGDLSGCGWGGFAEYVCATEDALALKPSGMTFEQAAATPQAGVLALQGLDQGPPLQAGQAVLLNGAGGGVGTFALQIAKAFGALVTCVDRAEKLEMLRSLGVDEVIDYKQQDFTKNGKQYDLILDVQMVRPLSAYRNALTPNGVYVAIGGSMARIFQLMFSGPRMSKPGNQKLTLLMHKPNPRDLNRLGELFESGKIAPVIDRLYPLVELADAFRYYGTGQVRGKIVIQRSG